MVEYLESPSLWPMVTAMLPSVFALIYTLGPLRASIIKKTQSAAKGVNMRNYKKHKLISSFLFWWTVTWPPPPWKKTQFNTFTWQWFLWTKPSRGLDQLGIPNLINMFLCQTTTAIQGTKLLSAISCSEALGGWLVEEISPNSTNLEMKTWQNRRKFGWKLHVTSHDWPKWYPRDFD